MLELNDSNVKASLAKGKFLFLFYTDWCPKCPPVMQMLSDLEFEADGDFQCAKINLGKNPEAALYYGVAGVPTVLVLAEGRPLFGYAGIMKKDGYAKMASTLLVNRNPENADVQIACLNAYIDELPSYEEGEE